MNFTEKFFAQLQADVLNSWGDETFSDVKVTYGNHEWNLHRATICARSEYFKKVCTVGLKESHEGIIRIEEMEDKSAGDIEMVLKYLYVLDYEGGLLHPVDKSFDECIDSAVYLNEDCFTLNVEMYYLAQYFQIPSLAKLAAHKFFTSAKQLGQNGKPDCHRAETLFLSLISSLELAYNDSHWSPRDIKLRDAIGSSVAPFANLLMKREDFQRLIRERAPALGGDIYLQTYEWGVLGCGHRNHTPAKRGTLFLTASCINCNPTWIGKAWK